MSGLIDRLSPGHHFLFDSIHQVIAPGRDCSRASAPGDIDWEAAEKLIYEEGLASLLYTAGGKRGQDVPDDVRARLRVGYLAARVRLETWLEPVVRRALTVLQGQGLRPIVLKGAALAWGVYPEPCQRLFADVDLLLTEQDILRAQEGLLNNGFEAGDEDDIPDHHLRPLYAREQAVGVELHRHLLPSSSPYDLPIAEFRDRAIDSVVTGVAVRVLAPTDALLVACLHLSYLHRYRRFPLRTLIDVLALTANTRIAIDWDLLACTARRSRTSGAVYWPLWLSRIWLGAPIPDDVLKRLGPPAATNLLTSAIADPAFIFNGRVDEQQATARLYSAVVDLSLRTGCSTAVQVASVLENLFPAPTRVKHLSPTVTGSRVRYAAYLCRPGRLARGLAATTRLVARVAGL